MYILKENIEKEYVIKKSKFICKLFYVTNEEEIKEILGTLEKNYKTANHICYAYIIKSKEKYNDDKEPTGTAGLPMLECLKKLNLTNVLAVVIRYFGGIKLGTGGLIRAYRNSIKETIEKDKIIPYEEFEILNIETGFENEKQINNLTKNLNIIKKEYKNNITYVVKVSKNEVEEFLEKIKNTNVKIK